MSQNMVGTKVAAELLGVSTSTLYRMVEQGILKPSKTPGGQRRFSILQLEEYKTKSCDFVAPQNPSQVRFDADSKAVDANSEALACDKVADLDIEHESTTGVIDCKPVDPRNTLNDLNGSQWLLETKSFFYQKGLGAKHPHAQIERQHPAPFSFQDISHLVTFLQKKVWQFLILLEELVLQPKRVNLKAGCVRVLNYKVNGMNLQNKDLIQRL